MPRQGGTFKVLNVAEKNDAAKRISTILSGGHSNWREGFSKYNKVYEFGYTMLGRECNMIMTSLSGHLQNYEFVGSYRKWHSCHPLVLFDAELEKCVTENMVNIKKTLEKEIRTCQALIIWTDCDREGENIGFEIINICRNIKPNVNVHRARFSEITERSITSACRNLVIPDRKVSDAVDIRQELDLRIGAAFTRFQTLRLQKVFPQVLKDKLISYGSCQFPTLGFVVERYKAREQFQSEPFWKIEVSHTKQQEDSQTLLTAQFHWKRHRLFHEAACVGLYANCCEPPKLATVIDVTSKPKSRWRPVAMETVEMEKLASRKLRINAKETMKIAEKLYTQGFISYPRTETNIFPKDINLSELVEQQTHHPTWGGFAQNLLEIGPTPRNGSKTDKAHPPIHPTKYTNNLTGNEARLYELITRHFLACCHRDAQGHETSVEIELGGENFVAQGLMIIAKNYLEVYIYDNWNAKVIPLYRVGDEFEPTRLEMTSGQTSAPPLLTEADLIALMDKHGIGTDATHAEHIETIKQRMYVGLTNDQRFIPGELGMGLVEGYNLMGYAMSRPELRAELESDLTKICNGELNKDDVCRHHVAKYRAVFQEAVNQADKLDQALGVYFGDRSQVEASALNPSSTSVPVRPCPSCGKDMVIKTKRDGGFMLSCMGYPDCRTVAFFPSSVLDAQVDSSVCQTCRPPPVHRVKLKIQRGSVPAYFDCEQVYCIGGCDEDVNNILGIRYKLNPTNQQGRQPQAPTSRRPPRTQAQNRLPPPSRGSGRRGVGVGSGAAPGFLGRGRGNEGSRRQPGKRKMSHSGTSRQSRPKTELSNNGRQQEPVSSEEPPTCNCGDVSLRLTVRKEGPNTGRDFFKCSRQDGGCRFFVWADAAPQQAEAAQPWVRQTAAHSRQTPATCDLAVKCRCNVDAVERVVQKEGANQGRKFLCCDKPRDQQCGFFEWADNPPTQAHSSGSTSFNRQSGRSGANSVGGSGAAATRSRKAPTCGICGTQGHTRRGCPEKD